MAKHWAYATACLLLCGSSCGPGSSAAMPWPIGYHLHCSPRWFGEKSVVMSTTGKLICLHSNTGMHGCSHAQNFLHPWSAHQTETLPCVTSQVSDNQQACGGLLERDIIELSTSLCTDPVVLVPRKHNSKPRFSVDYRKMNAATHTVTYPLPNNQ